MSNLKLKEVTFIEQHEYPDGSILGIMANGEYFFSFLGGQVNRLDKKERKHALNIRYSQAGHLKIIFKNGREIDRFITNVSPLYGKKTKWVRVLILINQMLQEGRPSSYQYAY